MPLHDDLAEPAAVMASYFRAWQETDFQTLRSLLADDVTFPGPLGAAADAEGCLRGLQGMGQVLLNVVIQHVFVDGPDVLTWFDLHTSVAPHRRPRRTGAASRTGRSPEFA